MANLVVKTGKTRGRNPRDIEYQAFDVENPDSLPKTMEEFVQVTGKGSLEELLEYLVAGFNYSAYSAASDEIGEFVKDEWSKEYQAQFRITIRNFSKVSQQSIEEVVEMLMPAIDKGWAKIVADKKAEAEKLAQQTSPAAV